MTPEELKRLRLQLEESKRLRSERGAYDDIFQGAQDFNAAMSGNKYSQVNRAKYNDEDIKRYEKLIDGSKSARSKGYSKSGRTDLQGNPLIQNRQTGEIGTIKDGIFVVHIGPTIRDTDKGQEDIGIKSKDLKEGEDFNPSKAQRTKLDKTGTSYHKETDNFNKGIRAGNKIITEVLANSKISPSLIQTQLPRLAGEVGNLSTFEQQAWSGSKAIVDRLSQFITEIFNSKEGLTDENRKLIFDLVRRIQGSLSDSRGQRRSTVVNQLNQLWKIPNAFSEKYLGEDEKISEETLDKSLKKEAEKEEEEAPASKGIKLRGKDVSDADGNPVLNVDVIVSAPDGTVFIVGGKKKYKYSTENGGWTLASKPRPGKEALPIKKEVAGSNVLNPDV